MSNDKSRLQRFKLNNSSSFNDLNSLSIYNNDNSYSSMSDVKNYKPLNNLPMGHSSTTQNDNNKNKKYNKHNVLRINTTSNNFKEKNRLNVKHYNKVSEVTLLDKPFSELIFNDNKEIMDVTDPEQVSPVSQTKKFTFLYGTAKDHGFGTNNVTSDNLIDDQINEMDNDEIQRYAPFGKKILNESTKSLTISQSNSVKNLKLEDMNKTDTLLNINRLNSLSSNNLNIKISQSNNLLNPIKELIIKQLNNEIEMSFKELDFYNNYKDLDEENKLNDNFYKIETIINDELINKKVLMFLNELDNSEKDYLKQIVKMKELHRWRYQTNNKIKQIENTIKQMYLKQINENLNEYHRMKEIMEEKFNKNLSKNEVMTNNYDKIIEKYNHLINVKLPNLERWNESITKMKNYEKKNKVTILNVYDITLLSVLVMLYAYYFYP